MYSRFFLTSSLFVLFIFNTTFANNNFFQCLEKISEVRSDNNSVYKKGTTYGISYIKLTKNKNSNQDITVHFKLKNSEEKPNEIIKKKNVNNSSLGFNIIHSYSLNNSTSDISYNFIEIDETYVFNKKNFSWLSAESNYDFDTTSRCEKINQKKYLSLLKLKTTAQDLKITKKITKKKNKMKGNRTFALSWEGIDELIIGQLSFEEENLIGKLDFVLSDDETKCIGTYVLSTSKGTWSILCEEKNMNASGLLMWNIQNGIVSGNGKDSKGNKVKFKVSGPN